MTDVFAEGGGRTLPQNIQAEQALLGACLLDGEAVHRALEYVRAEDFLREDHRLIFGCLQKLTATSTPCDLVTVADALLAENNLERAGGAAYIASLTSAVPSSASVVYYAKIVAEKSLLRALVDLTGQLREEALTGEQSGAELLEEAERAILAVGERRNSNQFYPISQVAVAVMEQIGKLKANQGITGVPTFRDVDRYLSGLQKSDLIILAARPGVGKTSMALNIAQQAACKYDQTVAIFSLEMPKEQLVQRMMCSAARVDQGKVRSGMASREELQNLSRQLAPLSKAEIYIDDTPGLSVMEMRSKCRKLKMEKKRLDLVVVDYLQLMQSAAGRRPESRQQEIAEISRSLKALAKELNVPVLALSQLSRLAERSNEAPSLSHLRESGALEQDADVVLFIHQPKEEEVEEEDVVELIIAKHRNGPTGQVKLVFLSSFTTFADYAQPFVGDQPF